MVSPVRWTEAMSLGIPEVDAQHQHLIALLNQLLAASSGDQTSDLFADSLASFSRRVFEHFHYEEQLQEAAGYPGLEEHRAQHEAYQIRITGFCQHSMGDSEALPRHLLEFLRDWWVGHLLYEDTRFRDFLAQDSPVGPDSSPVPSSADENSWFG